MGNAGFMSSTVVVLRAREVGFHFSGAWSCERRVLGTRGLRNSELGLGLSAAIGFRLYGGQRSDSWVWAFCYYGQGFSGFAINSDFRGQDLECVV